MFMLGFKVVLCFVESSSSIVVVQLVSDTSLSLDDVNDASVQSRPHLFFNHEHPLHPAGKDLIKCYISYSSRIIYLPTRRSSPRKVPFRQRGMLQE